MVCYYAAYLGNYIITTTFVLEYPRNFAIETLGRHMSSIYDALTIIQRTFFVPIFLSGNFKRGCTVKPAQVRIFYQVLKRVD